MNTTRIKDPCPCDDVTITCFDMPRCDTETSQELAALEKCSGPGKGSTREHSTAKSLRAWPWHHQSRRNPLRSRLSETGTAPRHGVMMTWCLQAVSCHDVSSAAWNIEWHQAPGHRWSLVGPLGVEAKDGQGRTPDIVPLSQFHPSYFFTCAQFLERSAYLCLLTELPSTIHTFSAWALCGVCHCVKPEVWGDRNVDIALKSQKALWIVYLGRIWIPRAIVSWRESRASSICWMIGETKVTVEIQRCSLLIQSKFHDFLWFHDFNCALFSWSGSSCIRFRHFLLGSLLTPCLPQWRSWRRPRPRRWTLRWRPRVRRPWPREAFWLLWPMPPNWRRATWARSWTLWLRLELRRWRSLASSFFQGSAWSRPGRSQPQKQARSWCSARKSWWRPSLQRLSWRHLLLRLSKARSEAMVRPWSCSQKS